MRISITLIFILSVLQLSGQDFQWAQQEGGDLRDIGFSIAVDGLGNSYVTGYFEGTAAIGDSTFMSFAERDIFVAKYDANGNFLWAQQDGGDGSDEGRGITVDGLGNCYVTGYFQGTATIGDSIFTSAGGNGDIFITKYDANGTFIWAIRDGGSSFDVGEGIAVDGSGNSFVTGFFTGTAEFGDTTIMAVGSSTDIFIMKYDQNGVFQWAHQDGGIFLTKGFGISVDGSSNSYITGFFRGIVTIGDSTFMSVGGSSDMFIAKYDADGNFQWAQQANGNAGSEGVGIGVDAQGNSYITGFFEGTFEIGSSTFVSTGLSDIFLVKYDTDGNFQWAIQDGGSDFDVGHGIAVDDLGNSSVTGYFGGTAAIGDSTFVSAEDSREIYISKYDIDGNFIWAKQDGGDGDDEAFGIAVDDQGNNYVTGYFTETAAIGDSTFMSFGDYDIFIAKYNCPIVAAPIPTLSQWGMMVLILCFMTIGIVFLRERKKGVA